MRPTSIWCWELSPLSTASARSHWYIFSSTDSQGAPSCGESGHVFPQCASLFWLPLLLLFVLLVFWGFDFFIASSCPPPPSLLPEGQLFILSSCPSQCVAATLIRARARFQCQLVTARALSHPDPMWLCMRRSVQETINQIKLRIESWQFITFQSHCGFFIIQAHSGSPLCHGAYYRSGRPFFKFSLNPTPVSQYLLQTTIHDQSTLRAT